MNIDRLAFLALASSLAAVACSSASTDDGDVDEGAMEGAACTAPGTVTSELPSTEVAYCEKLAEGAERKGEHYPSVRDTCVGYLSAFKSAAATKAKTCMRQVETASANELWSKLYGCGYEALEGTCTDAQVESFCAGLGGDRMFTRSGSRDPEAVKNECRAFLSGLEPRARESVVSCVKAGPYPVFSCIEGMRAEENVCIAPSTDGDRRAEIENRFQCDRELTVQASKDLCIKLVANAQPAVANAIIARVRGVSRDENGDPRAVSEAEMFKIGVSVLHTACRQPAEVDAICAEGVRALVGNGASNAGGRLTNECRSLLAGLTPTARQQMKNLMSAIQNGAAYTRKPGGLSQMINLLNPCPDPHPDVCLDDSEG